MSRVHSSLPAKSKPFRIPVPVITQTCLPSVTGDGDDMFCLLPIRFSPASGRFQATACLLRSTAQSSICPVARSVATFRKMVSFQMMGVEPLKAGSGSFHATFSVALQVVGRPFSVLMPSIDGPRQWGQVSAAREAAAEATTARVRKYLRMLECIPEAPEPAIDSTPRRWHRRLGVREDDEVQVNAVPPALRDRLGPEGTTGLLGVLDLAEREWRDDVLSLAGERFERRLAETGASLRVQIAQSEAAIRGEMASDGGPDRPRDRLKTCRGD